MAVAVRGVARLHPHARRQRRLTSINRSTKFIDGARDLGRDIFDFITPGEQAAERAALDSVRAGGPAVTLRSTVRLPDGTRESFDTRFIKLRDGGGVMLLVSDVTAEIEAAAEVERTVRRFRALVERSQDVISQASRNN